MHADTHSHRTTISGARTYLTIHVCTLVNAHLGMFLLLSHTCMALCVCMRANSFEHIGAIQCA
jgi:hypothetical protein